MNKKILCLCFLLFASIGIAQNLKVQGTVTQAEDGEPLVGAPVLVKGNPSLSVTTDIDGNYIINVPMGKTLVFSYIGCKPIEKVINESQQLNVQLTAESHMLDEVVAIGYGTMKKSDLTGAVSTISSDKLQKTPAASLANALQGQAAGVSVNSNTGQPGAAPEVRIRGVGTINGASPIYVVDGVIVEDISFLSPNDIEHTEVLKDASATAIYGSRGANGVIIVTTRGGKVNKKTNITLDAYIGLQQRYRKLDVMNAKQFADTYVAINGNKSSRKVYEEQGFNKWLGIYQGINSSIYHPTIYDAEKNPNGLDYSKIDTDWQDEVFRDAMIQNYHLAFDGGSEKTTYSMSGSWYSQDGTIMGSNYQRLTVRLNTSHKVTDWLKIGENISFMSSTSRSSLNNSESAGASILSAALAMAPWDPVRYPQGSVNKNGKDLSGGISAGSNFKNVTNPYSMVEYSHPSNRSERFVGIVYAELTPIKNLTLRSSYSFDYNITTAKLFKDKYEVSAYDKSDKNFLSSDIFRYYNWNVDNIATYTNSINDHDFSVMAGQTIEEYNTYGIGNSGSSILNPEERNWYLSQVTDDFGRPGDTVGRSRRFSFLGRLYYSFKNRYMLTVNFRADGSSKFAEKPWGYFPSTALAWRISEESFMKDITTLDMLKLRVGWGKVGNDKINDNAFILNMFNQGPSFVDYVFGKDQQLANGATVLTWINNGGHWENTEQWSLGVDFGLWGSRLTGSVDLFIRNTNDMLIGVTAPAHVGNRYAGMSNVGTVSNKGVELTLDYRNNIGDLSYSVGGNISFIKNKMTGLNGGSPVYGGYSNITVVNEGYPLYYFWGYQYDGMFRTDEEALEYLHGYTANDIPFHAGDAKYRDVSGDGKIDDKDRVDLGSSIPTINYGINIGAGYKGFDLQLFFQGVGGNKIYNQVRHRLESTGTTSVLSPIMVDAWTTNNPDGTIPNPKNSINYYASSRFLESGAYFRLKNLQIGYTLPAAISKKAFLQNCRFYLQGSNLFTITKYNGYDPEVGGGIDYGNYPQSRTYIFGVNITY